MQETLKRPGDKSVSKQSITISDQLKRSSISNARKSDSIAKSGMGKKGCRHTFEGQDETVTSAIAKASLPRLYGVLHN
ncbi:Hypothetical protein NTJ_06465 [Nesidiocoris tenuis]|uniref:Uncharacterized protein n=1 Tax=Nesidiocoris tenuis TaxID=355587 RepID=A0ABN7AN46_9HEMI|nr:Hypothetical protein NTJ_06465 [Nesidiocoris tenuis]